MKQYLSKNLTYVILVVLGFQLLLNYCSITSGTKRERKLQKTLDSLKTELVLRPTRSQLDTMIYREGLRVEKRMIQSTDRRMMDVSRQTEIDKELANF